MALVTSIKWSETAPRAIHRTSLMAVYSSAEIDERRIFQIDSFGSEDRAIPGKKSQTFQFDEKSGRQLFDALRREFGF